VRDLPFVVPSYDWWEGPFYGIGLKIYDLLGGKHGFGRSRILTREETVERIPTLETEGLRGGVIYRDGQFDDARLAIDLAKTAALQGAVLLNYFPVRDLLHERGLVRGVVAEDGETAERFEVRARVVVNATGPFADTIRRRDDPGAPPIVRPSQGVHLVLDESFLPEGHAILLPSTDDGRVLFLIPWNHRTLVGTTETPVKGPSEEPRPFPEEVEFLLAHANRYLRREAAADDVRSAFAGLRPLVDTRGVATGSLSRDHSVHIARSGLVTVVGGKWTTYRRMAEDAVDAAIAVGELAPVPCGTSDLAVHGQDEDADRFGELAVYGASAPRLAAMIEEDARLAEPIHPDLPVPLVRIVWAVRQEMARSVEDCLSRRTRALLLDAAASVEAAPRVASVLARELGRDAAWERGQMEAFRRLAERYRVR
jgi:glycerol-3-phosphate dehydrogenase